MRELVTYEWFTICIILGLIIITITKSIYSARFNDFLFVVGNSKYLKIYSKELKFIDFFDGLLFLNLVLSVGVFSHIALGTVSQSIPFSLVSFLKLCFAIAVIFLSKTLLERIIGSLFEIEGLMNNYQFQKTTYKNFTGIILLISNMFLLYALQPSSFVIYALIGTIFVINSIGFITSFKNNQNLLSSNFFYFLLYLCALEIGPYVILYKVIMEFNA